MKASPLGFAFLFLTPVVATLCGSATEGLTGLGEEIALTALGKLAIVEFSASVSYTSLPVGASPYIKILAASEQPSVFVDDAGVLTISPEDCDGTTSAPTDTPTASPSSASMASLSLPFLLLPTSKMTSLLTTFTLLGSLAYVNGAGHTGSCIPTLEIEIGVPETAPVRTRFGETDHYLAATVETLVWGYFDPTATNETASITMGSGETITVEVITHHSGHDYAKMIQGDPAVAEVFYWEANQTLLTKPEPKLPGSGVHLVTGPINVEGAMPGDIVEIEILELEPRYNPATGRCFGTNSQKFAGYQYRVGTSREGIPYTRAGGTEAITVFEFIEDDDSNMLYALPVYMYRFPNMTDPDGNERTFDNNPAVTVPHEFNVGYDGALLESEPIFYPPGFDDTVVTDDGGIKYLSPDPAMLNWKVPLRPHLGTLAVMPANADNYIDAAAPGGANTIPPSRFGGNIDDWRIGKGGTMFYKVELPGALIVVGDTHAAQGDSELAGTAMETSMTTKLRVTLHKADALPKKVATLDWPLLETSDKFIVHGFAFANYLDELPDPSDVFAEGASLDLALEDCFIKTRNWLMDVYDLIEEETIVLMTTSVDFGITQIVDGNWGVHADIPKWVFDTSDTPYDYSCTPAKTAGRRNLNEHDRRSLFAAAAGEHRAVEDYANRLYETVTKSCETCDKNHMRSLFGNKLVDAKLQFIKKAHAEVAHTEV